MEDFLNDPFSEEDSIDITRYMRGFIKRWWLILLLAAVVIIPWFYYVSKQPPMYEAETWISFESVGRGIPESLIQSRRMKLTSRTFAEEVTAELGLTLELSNDPDDGLPIPRQTVFKTFSTTNSPVAGPYGLVFYPSGYCSIYLNDERIDSLYVGRMISDTLSFNGISLSLQPDIIGKYNRLDFRVRDFDGTVRSLRAREQVNFNRTGDLMSLSLQDKDPVLVSETVNALADVFIRKSQELERDRSRFMSNYLKEQLNVIQNELAKTDHQLKSFRNTHLMGLDATTQQTISQLDNIENARNQLTVQRNQLSLLLNKLDPSSPEFSSEISMPYVYRQIAQLPVFTGDANMAIADQELRDLSESRNRMLQNYPSTNPTVMEVTENMQQIESQIMQLASDKLVFLDSQLGRSEIVVDSLQQTLRSLPEEELQRIKLNRQRRTNEELYDLYMRRYREARISEAVASENVTVLDSAVPPREPIRAGKTKKMLMGLMVGFGLGFIVVFIIEISDKRIKNHDDVRRYLKLPILGIIPMVKFDDYEIKDSEKAKSISSQIVTHDYSPTPVGEAYRALRTNLLFSKRIGPIRSLVVGSVSPGEGKSFTAANLAITLAQQKSKTLLVDADLRRGVLHNSFNCAKKPGLTNYLTGVVPLENVLHETYIPNLSLITCGSLIPNPSELLGSVRMQRFIEGITKRYEFVIFDTPPLLAATDGVILGTLVDGTAIVIRAGKSNRDLVQRRLEVYQNVEARLLGTVLNCTGVEIAHDGYSYYRY